jgi:chemotaxis family two-component system response regulator Rcp1
MPRPRVNLLLAEDNFPDTLIVREAIRKEDLPVDIFVVSDGEQAIHFIDKAESDPNAPCPQALLLDLNLPKVDGFGVLRRIRASTKCANIPVLIFTSSDSPEDRSESAKLGASYFRKPPAYTEFLRIGVTLKKLLEQNGLL